MESRTGVHGIAAFDAVIAFASLFLERPLHSIKTVLTATFNASPPRFPQRRMPNTSRR